jgi:hypothetical protein
MPPHFGASDLAYSPVDVNVFFPFDDPFADSGQSGRDSSSGGFADDAGSAGFSGGSGSFVLDDQAMSHITTATGTDGRYDSGTGYDSPYFPLPYSPASQWPGAGSQGATNAQTATTHQTPVTAHQASASVLTDPSSVSHDYTDGPISYMVSAVATSGGTNYQSNTLPLTVNAAAPTVSISGSSSVYAGAIYTLTLNATTDSADHDPITGWEVVWGDGMTQEFSITGMPPATSTTVQHVYCVAATRTIS